MKIAAAFLAGALAAVSLILAGAILLVSWLDGR